MATGISLHIGVCQYNRQNYRSVHKTMITNLPNCERDANAQKAIAERFGFKPALLVNETATVENVMKGIGTVAHYLNYGDMFYLSFSGHGGRVWDKNNDEEDGYDETWCLYDRMLLDDDLFDLLKQFRPGVRILIIADSCHSGTSIKSISDRTMRYAGQFPPQQTEEIQAAGLLMAACQDEQSAFSGKNINYSLYTYWMLKVLEQHDFCDSYIELHNKIRENMPPASTPNLFLFGPGADQFARTRPFRI